MWTRLFSCARNPWCFEHCHANRKVKAASYKLAHVLENEDDAWTQYALTRTITCTLCIAYFDSCMLLITLCTPAADWKVKDAKEKLAHALANDEDAWTQYVLTSHPLALFA